MRAEGLRDEKKQGLREQGHAVLEVNRLDRPLRHRKCKSDPLDGEGAARVVLSGQATALPKSGTGAVEMIRHSRSRAARRSRHAPRPWWRSRP
jgi:hypothetical protein